MIIYEGKKYDIRNIREFIINHNTPSLKVLRKYINKSEFNYKRADININKMSISEIDWSINENF